MIPEGPAVLLVRRAPQTYKSLANARHFMRDAYRRPVSLPDISARANLSTYHFLRVHKLTFGETPHEFLTRLRIERAKALLARGSHNVTETCFEVGFSSLGSFSAMFNHRVGLPFAVPASRPVERRGPADGPAALFVPECFFAMFYGSLRAG